MKLSKAQLEQRKEQFVRELLKDPNRNGKEAAIRAGVGTKSAKVWACRTLKDPAIQAKLQKVNQKINEKIELSASYVLDGIRTLVERCIQAEEVRDREGNPTGEYQFEAHAALKGYELLGKHLKLFTEKHELKVEDFSQLSDEQLNQLAVRLGSSLAVLTPGGRA